MIATQAIYNTLYTDIPLLPSSSFDPAYSQAFPLLHRIEEVAVLPKALVGGLWGLYQEREIPNNISSVNKDIHTQVSYQTFDTSNPLSKQAKKSKKEMLFLLEHKKMTQLSPEKPDLFLPQRSKSVFARFLFTSQNLASCHYFDKKYSISLHCSYS